MTAKNLTYITMFCALIAQAAQAAPTVTVTPGPLVAGNRQWTVYVTPDASLFVNSGPMGVPPNTVGGSVAVEFGFMVVPGSVIGITTNTINFPQNLNPGTPIPGYPVGPGAAFSGNKAVAFLGSDFFTSATPHHMVTITTTGAVPTTLSWLGAYNGNARIAQAGLNYNLYNGSITVPEPASCALAIFGLAGAVIGCRRTRSE